MDASLLTRRSHNTRPGLHVLDGMALAPARLHELCGPARHRLAMLVAAATQGPVFWITPDWQGDRLHPDGMAPLVGPERFTFVTPRRAPDLLWTLEEVLRSGSVPLAVAELPEPPGLTAVRRLHLAAETGAAEGRGAPLGLILTPGEGGAPGVESRWHMAPAHAPGRPGWTLERRRARTLPPQSWQVSPGKTGFVLDPREETANSV
ncbi:ImuA family protein [Roseovarius aestuariivivens]|uniref:ImuA family protein n=1 Tax=Roseovarius aestuariivivens TaxID=1888910 RepID=UPI0010800230|nr:hypothetical protein [Roseovarius aestuariivivens]